MKYNLTINKIKTIREIEGYWTNEDYIKLLEEFGIQDSKDTNPSELRELLEMAITDFDPNEAAEIILQYKLSDKLNKGQIQNLSNEMLEDNEAEEFPDISLHFPLFSINQLLNKAYNGTFPNAKATSIDFDLSFAEKPELVVSKKIILQAIGKILRQENLIIRLYEEELEGKKPFEDAEKIVWKLIDNGSHNYSLITSDYWINDEDLTEDEISSTITEYKP